MQARSLGMESGFCYFMAHGPARGIAHCAELWRKNQAAAMRMMLERT